MKKIFQIHPIKFFFITTICLALVGEFRALRWAQLSEFESWTCCKMCAVDSVSLLRGSFPDFTSFFVHNKTHQFKLQCDLESMETELPRSCATDKIKTINSRDFFLEPSLRRVSR